VKSIYRTPTPLELSIFLCDPDFFAPAFSLSQDVPHPLGRLWFSFPDHSPSPFLVSYSYTPLGHKISSRDSFFFIGPLLRLFSYVIPNHACFPFPLTSTTPICPGGDHHYRQAPILFTICGNQFLPFAPVHAGLGCFTLLRVALSCSVSSLPHVRSFFSLQ